MILENAASEKSKRGKHTKYLPFVFTEHVVLTLANILKSEHTIKVIIQLVDVFVKLRKTMLTGADVAKRLEEIENRPQPKSELKKA